MATILITGATGTIGKEVIHFLDQTNTESNIIAAVRNISTAQKSFSNYRNLAFREFDFEDFQSQKMAFENIDILFLLRPPHISDIEKYFKPLLTSAKESGINKIVFLSVLGAEKSKMIPHNKIERLIKSFGFNYIFVRPSYFMQNLTSALLTEIKENQSITLPSGNAKFNWIDAQNIGEVTALLINSFDENKNQGFEIIGDENKNFSEVTSILSEVLETNIQFVSINPVRFYFKKKKEGLPGGFAMVMTILHFLPKIQKEPVISDVYFKLCGKNPNTVKDFVLREKDRFTSIK